MSARSPKIVRMRLTPEIIAGMQGLAVEQRKLVGAHYFVRDVPEPPQSLPLPAGFRDHTVEDTDVRKRVAIHREVWAALGPETQRPAGECGSS
jgi:hypothetical protein